MPKRYCGMCDKWMAARVCKACGADTDPAAKEPPKAVDLMDALRRALPRLWHICHDMNPPHPGPCAACAVDREVP